MILPVSRLSSSANTEASRATSSASLYKSLPLADAVIDGQGPLVKAVHAALTARSVSFAEARGITAHGSSVAGSMLSKAPPCSASQNSPSIRSLNLSILFILLRENGRLRD